MAWCVMYPLYGDTNVCLDSFGRGECPEGFAEALVCGLARPELGGVSYMAECPVTSADATTVKYALPRRDRADVLEQVTCSPGLQRARLVFPGGVTMALTPGEVLDLPLVACDMGAEVWADRAPPPPLRVHARCAVLQNARRREVMLGTASWRGFAVSNNRLSARADGDGSAADMDLHTKPQPGSLSSQDGSCQRPHPGQ